MDHEGKNVSLVSAGFRNHFDAAFSPFGELFTFDSDMEWDEALPWYRAVRVCHCPPGADFVWRTGAANTPDYYIDSLPPTFETGRGSPVGLEFYDHHVFPEKYRGAFFMADWAIGVIFAVHLERSGASYKAKVERFCQGAPMNVTDISVGPDGALYFAMGGRGSQGGVYRIAYPAGKVKTLPCEILEANIPQPQPLAAWSEAPRATFLRERKRDLQSNYNLIAVSRELASEKEIDHKKGVQNQIQILSLMQRHGIRPRPKFLLEARKMDTNISGKDQTVTLRAPIDDKEPDVRAHAVWLLGVNGYKEGQDALVNALKDADAMVRRRACEALIRAGIEPPVAKLWPLLGDGDRFVRHAARLVLERIEPGKW